MKNQASYDAIVVGAGVAGLTSAAYLCKYGYKVLLCEKEAKTGGLVSSFNYRGFYFDAGIRAFENSGIILPMLKQLGIEMEFVKNPVSIGIGKELISLDSKDSLWDYEKFLCNIFPENIQDIHKIILEIQSVMKYMDVIYGIDNPLFLDYSENIGYIFKTLIPWLFRYQVNIKKAMKLNEGVNDYLLKFTDNQALIDMITQHFFKNTPSFFALSYFGLYLDYCYPLGGTSLLAEKLTHYIKTNKGDISTNTEVSAINAQKNMIRTADGKSYGYDKLIWAGDSKRLFTIIEDIKLISEKSNSFKEQKELVENAQGGDSVLTIYLGVNLDRQYFKIRCGPHLFYTPKTLGISSASLENWDKFKTRFALGEEDSREELKSLLSTYLELTTFEISCPVLHDESLAPQRQTGLIISTLIDYSLVKAISDAGWYGEFKEFCSHKIIEIMNGSIFKELKENVEFSLCSTPLTIEKITGNHGGAITGWKFSKAEMPSEVHFQKIAQSVLTPIPDILQAGQWTFSPSGLPISILTAKLAADKIKKDLKSTTRKAED